MTGATGRRLGYLAITLAVVGLDRITKTLAESSLDPYRSVTVVPGLFDLTLVKNPGGVFGILKNLDPGFRSALFTIIPLVAILLIGWYAVKVAAAHTATHVSLALILGGAIGNLIDRLKAGHVTDFLDFYWRGYHWPAFNLADSAICVGVGLLLVESLFSPGDATPRDEAPAAEPSRSDTP